MNRRADALNQAAETVIGNDLLFTAAALLRTEYPDGDRVHNSAILTLVTRTLGMSDEDADLVRENLLVLKAAS